MKRVFAIVLLTLFVLLPLCAIAEEASGMGVKIDLTQLIISVVAVVFNIIMLWVSKSIVPSMRKWLDAKTEKEDRERIFAIVKQTVEAAEQLIGRGFGDSKRKYVVDALYEKGIEVDGDMIEAAVKEMSESMMSTWLAKLTEEDAEAPETQPEDEDQ